MDLTTAKQQLTQAESELTDSGCAHFATFSRDDRALRVYITARLRKALRKEGLWRSREMLATLKNAAYGFDPETARSPSGRDGIFLLDRTFRPPNAMMRKIFDHYLDHPNSGAAELAESLGLPLSHLLPVRLVSHHMRLLGVLARTETADSLVLVDCDRS
ncbi:MAG: hypothetical protein R3B70_04570 [Polyangiaceae bacterium]